MRAIVLMASSRRIRGGHVLTVIGGLGLLTLTVAPLELPEAVDRIQLACLRSYPREMFEEMTSGADEIPQAVAADSSGQTRLLNRQLTLEKGIFYPTLLQEVLRPFERYVRPGTRLLDLGSGDGRVIFLANVLGAEATGIEYDRDLVATSRRALASLADLVDAERIRIVQGDFFESSWSGYDVIYYFDLGSFEQHRLRDKMRRELDPRARLIVGHEKVPFEGLEVETTFPDIKVYRHPDPGEGTSP